MAYMPAELDDDFDDYENGFMGDEECFQEYMNSDIKKEYVPPLSPKSKGENGLASNTKEEGQLSTVVAKSSHSTSMTPNMKGDNRQSPKTRSNGKHEKRKYASSSASHFDSSAMHVLTEEDLKVAAVKGNVDLARKCLQHGVSVNASLQSGWSPLMYACNHGKWQVTEMLLQEGANPSYHVDFYTPLMCACSSSAFSSSTLACVKLLKEAGADINAKDRHHSTGLILASRLGHLDIVQYLIGQGAEVNTQDSKGWTALSWSVQRGHKEVAMALLDGGADCNIKHTDRLTAKEMAAHLPTDEMLALLEHRPVKSMDSDADMTGRGVATSHTTELYSNCILSEGDDLTKSLDLRYGELEIFLLGLDLSHLLPLFRHNLVDLFLLLELTEQDLINVGVDQLGARKRILDACQAVHQKDWEPSSLVSVNFNKRLQCADAIAMVANTSKHIRYINTTMVYIHKHLRLHPKTLLHPTDRASPSQLMRHVTDQAKHVGALQSELASLEKNLLKAMENQNTEPADLISTPTPKGTPPSSTTLKCAKGVGIVLLCGSLFYVLYHRDNPQHWTSPLVPIVEQFV